MYLKKVKSKGKIYLKLVETKWDKQNKKRVQKTILNLGRLDTLIDNGLPFIVKKLAETISEELKENKNYSKKDYPNLKDINTITHKNTVNYGHITYRKIWNDYDFGHYFELLQKRSRTKFNFSDYVYLMVINQLLRPSSKLNLWENYHYFFGIENIQLQNLYRSLDILADNKEDIEDYIFNRNKNLFNQQIDVVFYDVTTFYFESQHSDSLRDFGFDKDNKINNVHIVMGLLIDKTGKPIGYELFKGNTYEGHTLLKSIEKLKQRFRIQTIVIVADKGLNSKMNLKEIRDAGYHYIVSGRLKNMKNAVKKSVLDLSDYKTVEKKDLSIISNYDEDDVFKYRVIDYDNIVTYKENPEDKINKKIVLKEKLICTYSSKRAEKDRKDRERMIEKAREIIKNNDKSKLKHTKGHKKYVDKQYADKSKEADYQLVLNEEKIKEDEKYDGFYVIQSSKEDLSATEVIENYHYLYKIEESFRIMKSTMQVRPINHWTEKRIEGHFVMSFIAFLLERELELKLLQNKKNRAPEKIKEAINGLQFSILNIEGQEYYLRNNYKKLASEIMAVLKLKQPENMLNKTQVDTYMKQSTKT